MKAIRVCKYPNCEELAITNGRCLPHYEDFLDEIHEKKHEEKWSAEYLSNRPNRRRKYIIETKKMIAIYRDLKTLGLCRLGQNPCDKPETQEALRSLADTVAIKHNVPRDLIDLALSIPKTSAENQAQDQSL